MGGNMSKMPPKTRNGKKIEQSVLRRMVMAGGGLPPV